MPFIQVLNNAPSISSNDTSAIIAEFVKLRTELDEIRANFNAVTAKLDADAGVTDTNYTSLYGFGTTGSAVTAAAAPARRFTPT